MSKSVSELGIELGNLDENVEVHELGVGRGGDAMRMHACQSAFPCGLLSSSGSLATCLNSSSSWWFV